MSTTRELNTREMLNVFADPSDHRPFRFTAVSISAAPPAPSEYSLLVGVSSKQTIASVVLDREVQDLF
jgi:hypothetical protein